MIISAAVRGYVNGEYNIFPVHRHADFFLWMKQLHCIYDKTEVEQGFLNYENPDTIRFISREEAYKIALEEGQLKYPTDTPGELFSEDLW